MLYSSEKKIVALLIVVFIFPVISQNEIIPNQEGTNQLPRQLAISDSFEVIISQQCTSLVEKPANVNSINFFIKNKLRVMVQVTPEENVSVQDAKSKISQIEELKKIDKFVYKPQEAADIFDTCTFVEYREVSFLVFPYNKLPDIRPVRANLSNRVSGDQQVPKTPLIDPTILGSAKKILIILSGHMLGDKIKTSEQSKPVGYFDYVVDNIQYLLNQWSDGTVVNIAFTSGGDTDRPNYMGFKENLDYVISDQYLNKEEILNKMKTLSNAKKNRNLAKEMGVKIRSDTDHGMRSIISATDQFGGDPDATIAFIYPGYIETNFRNNSIQGTKFDLERNALEGVNFPVYFRPILSTDKELKLTRSRTNKLISRIIKNRSATTSQSAKAAFGSLIKACRYLKQETEFELENDFDHYMCEVPTTKDTVLPSFYLYNE